MAGQPPKPAPVRPVCGVHGQDTGAGIAVLGKRVSDFGKEPDFEVEEKRGTGQAKKR